MAVRQPASNYRVKRSHGRQRAASGCEVPSLWSGGCRINFDPQLTGPGIAVPPNAQGVEISNLELRGGNCWVPPTLLHTLPPRINGWDNDGILLAGGEPKLENVIVACFKRHGIHVAGDSVAYAAKRTCTVSLIFFGLSGSRWMETADMAYTWWVQTPMRVWPVS